MYEGNGKTAFELRDRCRTLQHRSPRRPNDLKSQLDRQTQSHALLNTFNRRTQGSSGPSAEGFF